MLPEGDRVIERAPGVVAVGARVPGAPLVPLPGGEVVHPGRPGGREREHVEGVALVFVGVRDGIADDTCLGILLNGVGDRAGADDRRLHAAGPHDSGNAVARLGEPEHRPSDALLGEDRRNAEGNQRGVQGKGKRAGPRVVPDLRCLRAEEEDVRAFDVEAHPSVRRLRALLELQRVPGRAIVEVAREEGGVLGVQGQEIPVDFRAHRRPTRQHFGARIRKQAKDVPLVPARDEEFAPPVPVT